jgi:hypothetical protein
MQKNKKKLKKYLRKIKFSKISRIILENTIYINIFILFNISKFLDKIYNNLDKFNNIHNQIFQLEEGL